MDQTTVTATRVPGAQRLAFLPAQFGARYIISGEAYFYHWARSLSVSYDGGQWEFYTLSNEGFFVAPRAPARLLVEVRGNGYRGEMSAEAFGVVVTLFVVGGLANSTVETDEAACERFSNQHHALIEFARGHAEQEAIFAAID
jgi:hypothetical protein